MRSSLIKLHTAVFLWGFTGVLGRLIHLNEGLLVWYRLLITIITLFILLWQQGELELLSKKLILKLFGVGAIIALHWVCFYGSIKASNVSICLTCLSSAGLFTALLEPLLHKRTPQIQEVLLSLLGIAGICLIFHFDTRYQKGIIIALIATLLSVIFSVLNKQILTNDKPSIKSKTLMFYELLGGFVVLTAFMPTYLHYFPSNYLFPTTQDWCWLVLMSWLCTVLAMDLSLQALKHMSAFTQNLTLNLEPVYGIILAFAVYKENKELGISFYFGFGLIVLSVILQMARVIHFKKL